MVSDHAHIILKSLSLLSPHPRHAIATALAQPPASIAHSAAAYRAPRGVAPEATLAARP